MKNKPYRGILAKPLPLQTPLPLNTEAVEGAARFFRVPADEIRQRWAKTLLKDCELIRDRKAALYKHYDIGPNELEAEMSLALSLALEHEREIFLRGKSFRYGALCEKFETTEPRDLVLKLAVKHVPGSCCLVMNGAAGMKPES